MIHVAHVCKNIAGSSNSAKYFFPINLHVTFQIYKLDGNLAVFGILPIRMSTLRYSVILEIKMDAVLPAQAKQPTLSKADFSILG